MDQDATWYGARPHPRRLCVRWRPVVPSPKKGAEPPPQFSAPVYCGQTAGWIKMALGKEVGLGPGHIVLDGDTAPLPQKGTEPPQFLAHVYCGQTAGWMKTPLGTEVDLVPGHIMLDGDHAPPLPKGGGAPPPNLRPTFIVAKLLDGSRWHLVRR